MRSTAKPEAVLPAPSPGHPPHHRPHGSRLRLRPGRLDQVQLAVLGELGVGERQKVGGEKTWKAWATSGRMLHVLSPTAEELLASVSGLSRVSAQQAADRIDECRALLAAGIGMDAVQQHLKDQGVSVILAVLITTRLLGDHPSRMKAAREIVEGSPARTSPVHASGARH